MLYNRCCATGVNLDRMDMRAVLYVDICFKNFQFEQVFKRKIRLEWY